MQDGGSDALQLQAASWSALRGGVGVVA